MGREGGKEGGKEGGREGRKEGGREGGRGEKVKCIVLHEPMVSMKPYHRVEGAMTFAFNTIALSH